VPVFEKGRQDAIENNIDWDCKDPIYLAGVEEGQRDWDRFIHSPVCHSPKFAEFLRKHERAQEQFEANLLEQATVPAEEISDLPRQFAQGHFRRPPDNEEFSTEVIRLLDNGLASFA